MRARHGLETALLAAAALLAPACAEPPPNVVLLIGDDHGAAYAGFAGSAVAHTPNLDSLARSGLYFRRAFTTASACRPSHRTLLTGLPPEQWTASEAALASTGAKDTHTRLHSLPRLLAQTGYETFQGGKLWEGRSYAELGFDHGTREAPAAREAGGGGRRRELFRGEAVAFGRETLEPLWEFLEAAKEGPFFVWFAPKLPHTPYDAGPRFQQPYRGARLSPLARAYYANVTRFDAAVGEVLAWLERAGLRERTVVLYVSDNGFLLDPPPRTAGRRRTAGKHSVAESGFHVPLLVSWPGHIAAGVRDDLVSTLDLMPTILGLAGVATPAGRAGFDLGPVLLRGQDSPRQEVVGALTELHPVLQRSYFLRTDAWRYVWDALTDRRSLYAIERDPREEQDLAAEEPEVAAELHARLERAVEALGQPAPEVLPASR
jgi:uncharacterized sulfatase